MAPTGGGDSLLLLLHVVLVGEVGLVVRVVNDDEVAPRHLQADGHVLRSAHILLLLLGSIVIPLGYLPHASDDGGEGFSTGHGEVACLPRSVVLVAA
jgi:hypothetical protein